DRGGALIDSALILDPGNDAYLDSKAWYLARKDRWSEAREVLEYLVKEEKVDDPIIWEHLAEVSDHLQDKAAALAAWRKVLAINPHHAKALERERALRK
ncbi:MAG TPA: hypothetical protein VLM37_02650, partial [Fibrobacteraceae bacterium]|nr:hypothetical protein [Fibrobacteraceae bacterium]